MRITCDQECNMGYIYLRKPRVEYINDMSTISKYVDSRKLVIPIFNDHNVDNLLKQLKIEDKTYRKALEEGEFQEEFYNDEDQEGYLTGIELSLSQNKFIELINNQAFRIYNVTFREKTFSLLTLDLLEKVLNEQNFLYPLTDTQDAFAVTNIISNSYYDEDDNEYSRNVCLVKGLLTSREDIYKIEYLSEPEFILRE